VSKDFGKIVSIRLIEYYKNHEQPLKGRNRPTEVCMKISNSKKGHTVSQETRDKISKTLKGNKNGFKKSHKINVGRKYSEETIEKMRKSNIGKHGKTRKEVQDQKCY